MSNSSMNTDDKNKDFKKFSNLGDNRKPNSSEQNKNIRNLMIWLIIGTALISIYLMFAGSNRSEWPVTYTEYKRFLEQDLIKYAKITKSQFNDFEFHGVLKDKVRLVIDGQQREITNFVTKLGVLDSKVESVWESKGIAIRYEESESGFWNAIISFLPWLMLIALYIIFIRRMQVGGPKGIFSFGKSRAKLHSNGETKITFEDVAGADEAKYELLEVIEFLRDAKRFQKLGGKIPKGVLLLGPPGTGKTLLARAVAGEANVPFFSISGADFVEMFVGVGASRVRDLFDNAKKNAPCLIFIDEIDAVGRHRGAGLGGGHDEREQTLNQLLVEMDGFEQNSGVIIIAATNRPDVLDPALLRPGRFDRQVVVDRPDVKGREGIFKVHVKNIPLSEDVDLDTLARATPGLSGADIANIVNESALFAARRNSDKVTMFDFENAKDKILMGIERKSMVISDKEKEMTAYHEMGHALVGKYLPEADPVHKVTIIPRGRALGLTSYLPTEDLHTFSQKYIETKIVTLMAGRSAEMLIFNNLTTGAANDLLQATKLARKMVCEWGMSNKLGPVTYLTHHDEVFLGRELTQPRDHSEDTAKIIDAEVRSILTASNEKAESILSDKIELLHKTSKILLEREVLDGDELDLLILGEDLPPLNKKTISILKNLKFDEIKENETNTEPSIN
ncbi:MAG: Cell division protease FtsH [Ignavibacteria bacterium]|nr:Cell division protease FtsH [Ignavibacteria bacterium]